MKAPLPFLLAVLFATSGCALVPVERYVHPPTAKLSRTIDRNGQLPANDVPRPGAVLLVPDFSTFTSSFSTQYSYLRVYTRDETPVFIESAVLEAPALHVRKSLDLHAWTQPRKLWKGGEGWAGSVRLFFDEHYAPSNFDFSTVRGAAELILIIRWRDGDRTVESRFELKRKNGREVAWIT